MALGVKSLVCTKVSLVIASALLFIIGVLLLGISAHVFSQVRLQHFAVLGLLDATTQIRLGFIACGCIAPIVALVGCVGGCRENRCLVLLHVSLVCLLLIVSLAAVSLAATHNGAEFQSKAADWASHLVKKFYGLTNGTSAEDQWQGWDVTAAVDAAQNEYRCCGWSGYHAARPRNVFLETPWYKNQSASGNRQQRYPQSCCAVRVGWKSSQSDVLEKCTFTENELEARSLGYMHSADCIELFVDTSSNAFRVPMGITVLSTLLQLWCLVFAMIWLRHNFADRTVTV